MNVEIRTEGPPSFFGKICFKFSVLCLFSVNRKFWASIYAVACWFDDLTCMKFLFYRYSSTTFIPMADFKMTRGESRLGNQFTGEFKTFHIERIKLLYIHCQKLKKLSIFLLTHVLSRFTGEICHKGR